MKSAMLLIAFLVLAVVFAPSLLAEIAGPRLDGAWQPDDYGTRVEIKGDTMTVLWRSAPVLETKFSVAAEGEKRVLRLEKTGLRYRDADEDYAAVTACWVEDGKMHLCQRFPITGDDEEILAPTTESRYGDVTVITEKMLPRLQGEWRTADGRHAIRIAGATLESRFGGDDWERPVRIAVVRYNWKRDQDRCTIVPEDPAQHELVPFTTFEYKKGRLHTRIIVHDADSPEFVFEKAE